MKIQQFHASVQAARRQIAAWRRDYRSSFAQDYGDYDVVSITLAKTGLYGKANVKTPTGRRLYDIHLRKRRRKRR